MMYQAFNEYPNLGYSYWNQMDDLNLNQSLNKLQLNPTSLYYTNSNRSYEINMASNPETIYAPVNSSYDLNDYNLYKQRNYYDQSYQQYKDYTDNVYANYEMNANYEIWNYQNEVKGIASSINDENEDNEWSDYSDSDTLEEYNRLFNKKMNEEAFRRLERNQGCLSILLEGDLIEYVENEDDLEEREVPHYWAIYMGNSMIMRFDNQRKMVIYESYWKIANDYYIFINKDLDKKLITLPIYEILKRARHAHVSLNSTNLSKVFSNDKNFATWCRFDINRSDIDLATDNGKYSSKLAKEFLFQRFFESIEKQLRTK